jgi:hypothetical protein
MRRNSFRGYYSRLGEDLQGRSTDFVFCGGSGAGFFYFFSDLFKKSVTDSAALRLQG